MSNKPKYLLKLNDKSRGETFQRRVNEYALLYASRGNNLLTILIISCLSLKPSKHVSEK